MKPLLAFLFLFALAANSAWARLGETDAQLTARFGPGTQQPLSDAVCTVKLYLKHGYKIQVYFLNGISVLEAYQMLTPTGPGAWTDSNNPIPPDQLGILLDNNAQGHHWTEMLQHSTPTYKTWKRDDDTTAVWNLGNLCIESKTYRDAEAAYQKSLEPSVKGF